jgi:1,4-dihydroxy-2-naphthoyl-CoA hydrolase
MPFFYRRTVRFQDTDAAGVVYFASVLSMCHEAYEASLAETGIELKSFFRRETAAVPIVHADIDYFQPMFCGETYAIEVIPTLLGPDKFQVKYTIRSTEQPENSPIASATTIHVCINPATRKRTPLSPELEQWLETIPSNLDIAPLFPAE